MSLVVPTQDQLAVEMASHDSGRESARSEVTWAAFTADQPDVEPADVYGV